MSSIAVRTDHIIQTIETINPASTTQLLSDIIIEAREVSKQFGKNPPVIENLSFKVHKGQIFCLLGPSGSGKSTTIRLLTGFYQPSQGEVRVMGVAPHRFNHKQRRRIGYMPQQFVLFPELSTQENINFVASVYGVSWRGRRRRVRQALEFVDLWDARRKLASQLSGGMLRRLELASAFIHEPDLIFVDEPTAGIDPVLRARFWEHFKTLRDQGRTLFITTQYVTEADYCDIVAILDQGHLLAIGTPEEIRTRAFGGELINLTLEEVTSQTIQILRRTPGLLRLQTISTENMRLTVENTSDALEHIITNFNQAHINLVNIEPYRPSFEEVFVELMENDNSTQKS
jgi:ABC-2 type transport system ATP-binding protein